jgi:hypothetical protein
MSKATAVRATATGVLEIVEEFGEITPTLTVLGKEMADTNTNEAAGDVGRK